MISFGKNITSATEPLQKIPVENICRAIKSPKPETTSMIRQLRIVRELDPKQYSIQKRRLPFLVCGIFNPSFRRIENFAYTEYFILDIDHVSDKEISLQQLRNEVEKDDRVVMCFVSPSEDGLKVFFRLKERCYDAGVYSLFYKVFARRFAEQYHIEQVVDSKTSDVTRACFVSVDPQVYFNPNAVRIDIKAYIDENDNFAFFSEKREIEAKEHEAVKNQQLTIKEDVGDDVIAAIKAIVQPAKNKVEKQQVFVPEELNEIIEELITFINSTGVVVTEVVNIQYGKKIRAKVGLKQSETNLFYGKHGFSVVISPRCGTNAELNESVAELVKTFLETYNS